MKKKVAQQLEELTPRERKTIYRAGCISERIGVVLVLVMTIFMIIAAVEMFQTQDEYWDMRSNYWSDFFSQDNVYGITEGDIEAADIRRENAEEFYRIYLIVYIIVGSFYLISSNIYLYKKVPHYTMRRFSYLFWSKKRRKKLFEE